MTANESGPVSPPLQHRKGVRERVGKGARWSALGGGVVAALDFVHVAVLAVIVGPTEYGLMAAVLIVLGFSRIIARMGFSESLIHHQDLQPIELASVYWLNVGSGVLMWALCTVGAPLVSAMMEMPLTPLLRSAAFVLILDSAGAQFDALFRKQLNFKVVAVRDIVALSLGTSVAVVHAYLFDGGAMALVLGSLAQSAARLLLLLAAAARHSMLPSLQFRMSAARKHIAFGSFRTGSMVANYFAGRADQMIVGAFMGPQALGYYNLAYQVAREPISKTTLVINNLALPSFALIQHDRDAVRRGYLEMIGLLMFVTAPVFIGMGVVAELAVPMFLGAKWAPTIALIQVLVLFSLVASVNNATGPVIWATGHARWSFWWNASMLVVKPLVLLPFALLGNVRAVAWGMLVLGILTLVTSYWIRVRRIVGPIGVELTSAVLRPTALALTMGVVLHFLRIWAEEAGVPPVPILVGMVATGACIYLGLVLWLDRTQVDRALAIIRSKRMGKVK